jgi:hypothetical protein
MQDAPFVRSLVHHSQANADYCFEGDIVGDDACSISIDSVLSDNSQRESGRLARNSDRTQPSVQLGHNGVVNTESKKATMTGCLSIDTADSSTAAAFQNDSAKSINFESASSGTPMQRWRRMIEFAKSVKVAETMKLRPVWRENCRLDVALPRFWRGKRCLFVEETVVSSQRKKEHFSSISRVVGTQAVC